MDASRRITRFDLLLVAAAVITLALVAVTPAMVALVFACSVAAAWCRCLEQADA